MFYNYDRLKEIYRENGPKDFSADYQYFNNVYSVNALRSLSDDELVERLFCSADYARTNNCYVGYTKWAESGDANRGILFGSVSPNKQVGIIANYDASNNIIYNLYQYTSNREPADILEIERESAIQHAKDIVDAFEGCVNLVNQQQPNDINDYRNLYENIKIILSEKNNTCFYWDENGEPNAFLIKYLHCSCKEYFSCTYSKEMINSIFKTLKKTNNANNLFFSNVNLRNLAKETCENTESFTRNFEEVLYIARIYEIVKNDKRREGEFKRWLEEKGDSNAKIHIKDLKNIYKKYKYNDYEKLFHIGDLEEAKAYRNMVKNDDSITDEVSECLNRYIEFLSNNNDANVHNNEENTQNMVNQNNKKRIKKNTILYGPPGTGKTYNTVIYAVSIVEEQIKTYEEIVKEASTVEGYKKVKARFDDYKKHGLIAFTTFHQSYSYEEFVEGIKPITNEANNTIEYIVKPGLFKSFCESEPIYSSSLINTGIIPDNSDTFDGLYDEFIEKISENDGKLSIGEESESDVLYLSSKGDSLYKLWNGQTGARTYITKKIAKSFWIDEKSVDPAYKKCCRLFIDKMKNEYGTDFKDYKQEKTNSETSDKKYILNKVFIIDEINRGNISKIFGELITLIEDSKREGMDEECSISLPYSPDDKPFSIPQNIYILGTMNTADRSIALIDTALRRRFVFEEISPNPKLLNEVVVDGIDIEKLLETLNYRIKVLYDEDHAIGHAYFLKLKNSEDRNMIVLSEIFKYKVIPLLKEYFYDDYEKIMMVLGDTKKTAGDTFFIKKEEINRTKFGNNDEIDDEECIYSIDYDACDKVDAYKYLYEE